MKSARLFLQTSRRRPLLPGVALAALLGIFFTSPGLAQPTWFSLQEGDLRSGTNRATVNTAGTLVTASYVTGGTYISSANPTVNYNASTNLVQGTSGAVLDANRVLLAFDLTPLANYVAGQAYSVSGGDLNVVCRIGAAFSGSSSMGLYTTTAFDETTATWNIPRSGAPAGGTVGSALMTQYLTWSVYPAVVNWTNVALNNAIGSALANPTNKTLYLMLKRVTENAGNTCMRYVTDENTDATYGGTDARPELQVAITILSNAPLVSVSATDPDASEPGANTGTFTISRSINITNNLTVPFTFSGSAAFNVDYTSSVSGSVTLPANVTSTNIVITPLDDSIPEDNETVILKISSSPNYGIAVASATVTISDDNDGHSLVQYMFGNTFAPQVWSPNITATTATCPGLANAFSLIDLSSPAAFLAGDGMTSSNETQAIAQADYLSVTVSPSFGYETTLTNLEVSTIYYNTTSLDAYNSVLFVRSSVDNFATTIGAVTNLVFNYGGGWQTLSIPLGPEFANRLGQVEFRLYIYDDSNSGDASTCVDNLFIRGDVNALSAGQQQVSITASSPNAAVPSTPGAFTLTRASDVSASLDVYYTVGGTASNGVDYTTLSGVATIPAGTNSTVVTVTPIDNPLDEGPELTVILTVQTNANYTIFGTSSATVNIAENVKPTQVVVAATDNNAYERLASLTGQFTITRAGDTSGSTTVNFSLGDTAVSGVDYLSSVTNSVGFGAGETSKMVTIAPIDNSLVDGTRTVVLTISSSAGYLLLGATNATVSIYDDEPAAAGTVLFSDTFETPDSATNYLVLEGASDGGPADSIVDYSFDYSTVGVPPAPGSVTTRGLKVTVNKSDTNRAMAAAINFFPTNVVVSNNFALRFNLYLQWNPASNFVETALAGINHSASLTNWGYSNGSSLLTFGDGQFVALDNSDTAVSLFGTANAASRPARLLSVSQPALAAMFNNPPYGASGGLPGVIGCASASNTKTWVDCELSQVDDVVRFKANGETLLTYTNTSVFTNGHVMIGYMDSFASLGPPDSFAIFDNVRVVQLPATVTTPPLITQITVNGSAVTINFTGASSDTPSSFKLQSSATAASGYADDNSAVITGSGGSFQATTSANGLTQFYRLRRN